MRPFLVSAQYELFRRLASDLDRHMYGKGTGGGLLPVGMHAGEERGWGGSRRRGDAVDSRFSFRLTRKKPSLKSKSMQVGANK